MIRKINGIEYTLTRKNVKNINLRISGGQVKVSANRNVPVSFIDSFVASRSSFIIRALMRCDARIPLAPPDISSEDAVRFFTDITERIYPRFSRFGFPFPTIKARLMKSQWGNCRRERGIVTFNKYLCALPERYAEFVAAHELSHMVVNDHSADFYAVLGSVMPDHETRRRELARYAIS